MELAYVVYSSDMSPSDTTFDLLSGSKFKIAKKILEEFG